MDNTPRIKAFNNIEQLIGILSQNGMQGFRPWRNDGYQWITFSDYKLLETEINNYSPQNNLAYYISSDHERFAEEIKLVLNINNPDEIQRAKDIFLRTALKTFSSLGLIPPDHLLEAINQEQEMHSENDLYDFELKILRTKVFSWSLIIRSK